MEGSLGVSARNVVVVGSCSAHLLSVAAAQSTSCSPPCHLIKFVGVGEGATASPKRRVHAGWDGNKLRTR